MLLCPVPGSMKLLTADSKCQPLASRKEAANSRSQPATLMKCSIASSFMERTQHKSLWKFDGTIFVTSATLLPLLSLNMMLRANLVRSGPLSLTSRLLLGLPSVKVRMRGRLATSLTHEKEAVKWDSDSDSDESDEEDLKV